MARVRMFAAGLTMLVASAAMAGEAGAQVANLAFSGPGIGGSLVLTYGPATDAFYPNAYEVTGISGTFFDLNNGLNIFNVAVGSLVPVTHAMPETGNGAAPHDFSRFAVAAGLPAQSGGFVTYDNLFWPAGSSQTATDYPPHGGVLDIYGLLFNIGGGRVVNLWSNGADENGLVNYGASVTTASIALDYEGGGLAAVVSTPEPGSLCLLATGCIGLAGVLTRRRRAKDAA